MARTPIISAWLLPAAETDAEDAADVVVTLPVETETETETDADPSTSTANPLSDATVQWA